MAIESVRVPAPRPSVTRTAGSSCTRPPAIGAVRSSGARVARTVLSVPRDGSVAVATAEIASTGPMRPVTPSARSPTIIPWSVPGSASL